MTAFMVQTRSVPALFIRRTLRIVAWMLAALLAFLLLYALSAWIGSSIPRNGDWQESADGVEILVDDNGVHTAILMPLVTPQKDWSTEFPVSDIRGSNRPYTHIAVSWGEKNVFLNTPTWSDLSASTVLNIVAGGGEGLLHVAHYVRPAPAPELRPLRISHADYARLVREIEKSIIARDTRKSYPGYGKYDVFYDAPGRYTLFRTCNQWTSNQFAAAGIRTGWWTPFPGGVMKWIPQLRESPVSK